MARARRKRARRPTKHGHPPRRRRRNGGERRVLIYPTGFIRGTWYGRHVDGELRKHRFTSNRAAVYGTRKGRAIEIVAHRGRLWAMR